VESVRAFVDAASAFFGSLAEVNLTPLAIALLLHVANLVLRTRAWLNILRAAYPTSRIRWRSVLGAYVAGVGVNSFAPARGGDVVKVYAVRQRVEGSSTPTIVSSLVAETVFDFFVSSSLLIWAYSTGRLPGLPALPSMPAFEWSFLARHERAFEVGLVIVLFALAVGVRWLTHHVRAFWQRVNQGLTILRTPRRYARQVVPYQAIGWCCRLGTGFYLLEAFNVDATLENALLVLVVNSISTLLPFTPGGVGPQQALLVVVLGGAAAHSTLLAYSVGAQAATSVLNIVLGFLAMFLLFRGTHWRHVLERAEASRHEPETRGEPPPRVEPSPRVEPTSGA
jgi:uncharacterized membrane protein YbhN (UPF0104 family)